MKSGRFVQHVIGCLAPTAKGGECNCKDLLEKRIQELESALANKEQDFKLACHEITRLENSDELRQQNVELQKAVNELTSFDAPAELVKAREELKALDTKYVKALEAVNDYMYKWGFSLKKVEHLEQREKRLRDVVEEALHYLRDVPSSNGLRLVTEDLEAALAE